MQWLSGDSPQLRRAAAQSLGLLAEAEGGQRFSRRLSDGALSELVLAALRRQQYVTALTQTGGDSGLDTGEDEGGVGSCPGWQEAYYCLIMMEKVNTHTHTCTHLRAHTHTYIRTLWCSVLSAVCTLVSVHVNIGVSTR